MNMPVPQGQQGQSLIPLGGTHMNMLGPQGQQGQPPATGPPGGGQNIPTAAAAPQAQAAQQGWAQIAVQSGGNTGVGGALAIPGRVTHGATSHEYSGISMALKCLAPTIMDADTSRNLCWQQAVAGDAAKLTMWKTEATSSPGLQFYAYATGRVFLVVGHSMAKIYINNNGHCHVSWEGGAVYGGSQRDS